MNEGDLYLIPELNAEKNGEYTPPSELRLAPAGEFRSCDGRIYRNNNPKALVNKFNREKVYLAIDFDHLIYLRGGGDASGWIEKLEERNGEIWATQIDWLSDAIYALKSKRYRYYSPHYKIDPQTREIKAMDVLSLVNRPATIVSALNSQQPNQEDAMNGDNLKDELNAALKDNARLCQEKNAADAEKSRLENELNSAKEQLKSYQEKEAMAINEQLKNELNSFLDEEVKAGRIFPAQKDFYAQTIHSEDELNSLRDLQKNAATLLPTKRAEEQGGNLDNELNSLGLDAEELDFARAVGLEPTDLKAQ